MVVPTNHTPLGFLYLQLINARLPYQFAFYQLDPNDEFRVVASSQIINVDPYEPV